MNLEDRRFYEQALQAMTPEEQAVLVPYYVHGYSSEEMAPVFGISHWGVRIRVKRALVRVRAKLGVTVCE